MRIYQFNLTESTLERLREHAKRHEISVSQAIRFAIAQYLKQYEQSAEVQGLTDYSQKLRVNGGE